MDLREMLGDPEVAPSIAWAAVTAACGDVADWEPETLRLELQRRGVAPTEALMAKLLGAQTIRTTNAVAFDHDVLFAFALACDGVPAAGDALHHPTVAQLAWAIREIDRLAPQPMSEDAGFDPDEIDPAVAVVLLTDGFAVAPLELAFCQPVLDGLTRADPVFRGEVASAWAAHAADTPEVLHDKLSARADDALGVQLCRLADVRCHVAAKEAAWSAQHDRL